jgi:ABC-type transporter Mla subunit MlaD
MKWEAADLRVGAVVLSAVAILLATAIWLSPAITDRSKPLYTEYDRIDGIAENASVMLNGYAIGRVASIEPVIRADSSLAFRVRMQLRWTLANGAPIPLRDGTKAKLVLPFPIGAGFINLEVPAGRGERLQPGDVVPGIRANAAVDQMQTMAEQLGGEMTTTLITARKVADDLSRTMFSARVLMDTLHRTVETVHRGAALATAAVPDIVNGLRQELAVADSLLQSLRPLVPAAKASIDSANLLMADSRKAVNEMSQAVNSKLPEIDRIIANLDTTTVLLTHLSRQISDRPLRVLTGVKSPPSKPPARTARACRIAPRGAPCTSTDSGGRLR